MDTKHNQYVPILKWMQGEYIALERLDAKSRNKLCPLFLIPPVQFDFEEWCPKHTVQEHIKNIPKKIIEKWGKKKAFIDFDDSLLTAAMDNGQYISEYIFEELGKEDSLSVPVYKLEYPDEYLAQMKSVQKLTGNGVLLRITFDELMTPNLSEKIKGKLDEIGISIQETDLLIDLGEPENFEPYPSFANALTAAISRISNLMNYRSFIVSGMSLKVSEIKKPGGEVPRHEWKLYQHLVSNLTETRCPTYSDYTIERPAFIQEDMRKLKPGGKIIYTTPNTWFISKGGAFRGNEEQMVAHCQNIIHSGYYSGPDYSFGDNKIMSTHSGEDKEKKNYGNLGTWKKVGINHHLKLVVDLLAKFHAS